MIVKNIYVNNIDIIISILEMLCENNISYVYIKEDYELHTENHIYRFCGIKTGSSKIISNVAEMIDFMQEDFHIPNNDISIAEPIYLDINVNDTKNYKNNLAKENCTTNQILKRTRNIKYPIHKRY